VNIELKGFQEEAARQLLRYVVRAREEARHGDAQAIVLSSPTGSGKTVTITALMEWIYEGHENTMGDSEAVFLWLSDSPELNQQSRDKILRQSSVFQESNLIIIEPPFSQKYFEAGKIYFLNTGKIGKDRLLTATADGRDYTIWQTIQNTATSKPDHFYLIIDEAHHGMRQSNLDRERAATIVQRFIKGFPEDGLQPVKLILGMSATPERFNRVIVGLDRTKREYTILPKDAKEAGLIKDKIILFHPKERLPAEWGMLEEATRRWMRFCAEWEKYCLAQKMEHLVKPVLVIQVENGNDRILTQTNLDELVKVVERTAGGLPEEAWAHAFQEDKHLEAGGRSIRKIDASKIQDDPAVRVVLFKLSLGTGWDCPRAEVMMSFRRANDPTHIAQLVGRMIRTPLARRIEGQEFLNTVALCLPHFERDDLDAIRDKLNNSDPEIGADIETENGAELVKLVRDPAKAELFSKLDGLPTYRVERIVKASNMRRLIKLARQLTSFDELDPKALGEAKSLVLETLSTELTRLRENTDFVHTVSENEEIEIQEVMVEYGEWKMSEPPKTFKIKMTPENIDDLFLQCGRRLGDEGLHMEFWKAQQDKENSFKAKLELFGILQDKAAWEKLERVCEEKIQQLFRKHHVAIEKLPSSRQECYWRIKRIAKHPEAEPLRLPPNLEIRMDGEDFKNHLFVDSSGKFSANLNTWETPVLKKELARPEVVGWLRNMPRKEWSLCVPYKMSEDDKPLFPDFIVFRTWQGEIVADILDPHRTDLPDAVAKAKGLAKYAQKQGDQYGRIELIIVKSNDEIKRLDLNKESIREEVLKVDSKSHLDMLFENWG